MNPEYQAYQQRQDDDQLRLLSIFFRVYGVLCFLASLFAFIYVGLGCVILANPQSFNERQSITRPGVSQPLPPPGFSGPSSDPSFPQPPISDPGFPQNNDRSVFDRPTTRHNDGPSAQVMGVILIGLGVFLFALIVTKGIFCLLTANWIRDRRNWLGVVIMSAIVCINVPIGTALGVFSLVAANRPSVKSLFGK
jgi:hypothetical protein